MQKTLILIKPDAIERNLSSEILLRIEKKGFKLIALKMLQATENMLTEHYAEHLGRPYCKPLIKYMRSGKIVAAVFEGYDIIASVRNLIGSTDPAVAAPGTIRGDLAAKDGGEVVKNLIHASDSEQSAAKEIAIWFPEL